MAEFPATALAYFSNPFYLLQQPVPLEGKNPSSRPIAGES